MLVFLFVLTCTFLRTRKSCAGGANLTCTPQCYFLYSATTWNLLGKLGSLLSLCLSHLMQRF